MDYKIGGHTIRIENEELIARTKALPNFTPFRTTAKQDQVLCTLSMPSNPQILNRRSALAKSSNPQISFMLAYCIAVSRYDTLALHASAVIVGGKALLFLGESGTGKSTHARLWTATFPGSSLLNDDNPLVRIIDGKAWAYGSPWSGKTPCYINRRAEIAAIVRLQQSATNRIERLNGVDSLCALLPSCPSWSFFFDCLADRTCTSLAGLLRQTPVYRLQCLPHPSAPELVYQTLQKDRIL